MKTELSCSFHYHLLLFMFSFFPNVPFACVIFCSCCSLATQRYWLILVFAHLCSSAGKETACNSGDLDWIPGSGISLEEGIGYRLQLFLGFPDGSDGKEVACNAGDLGSIPGLGRVPGEGNGNTLQYSCLENSMDRGPWQPQSTGCKELDTVEPLSLLALPGSLQDLGSTTRTELAPTVKRLSLNHWTTRDFPQVPFILPPSPTRGWLVESGHFPKKTFFIERF